MRLEAQDISFSYESRKILKNISFQAEPGEILGLLGPNGTGKTTLLKCLNYILKPTAGVAAIDGVPVERMKPKERAASIGYVPQSTLSPFPVSVIDAIMMGRIPFARGRLSEHDKEIVFKLMKLLELEQFAFQNLNMMSGGERQRVLVARALVQEPKILLLDEPTSALDLKNQLFILNLIQELAKKQNLTIIMTIHDLNLAAMFADKLIMLKDAGIYAFGSCSEVIEKENIKCVYEVNTHITTLEGTPYVRLLNQR